MTPPIISLGKYRNTPQRGLIGMQPLIVDNFAGGGGASTGIELALGRDVDIAINHDRLALDMHTTNHPHTEHYCESVWDIKPMDATKGMPVGLAWFSPDCTHHSKARGGKPVKKNIRGLAWVALRWAATVKPQIIMLENVEEFVSWGPLKNDKPDRSKIGITFKSFTNALRRQGYSVDHKILRACDFGAPTTRKRLFLVARCDGQPIVWPKPTHGKAGTGLMPFRTAAECIDWSLPCPSIFERKKPLVANTLRRIARGIQKFVIDNPKPFIVRIGHTGFGGDGMQYSLDDPLTTITSKAEHCLVIPIIDRQFSNSECNNIDEPLGTVTAGGGGKSALCAAFLAKHYGGNYTGPGADLDKPMSTVTAVDHHALVTSHLIKFRGTCQHGQRVDEPAPTITASGNHLGEVRAFLIKYYGTDTGQELTSPMHTITGNDRFGLVTIRGEEYQIVDIGMRMLQPHELFKAQGFPDDYIIDRDANGRPLTKAKQVHLCGNSVSPPVAQALVSANAPGCLLAADNTTTTERQVNGC